MNEPQPDPKFKEADLVRLLSGGPVMTVEDLGRRDGITDCLWFNSAGDLRRDSFHEYTLMPVRKTPETYAAICRQPAWIEAY